MPAGKKYTQFIFDHIQDPGKVESYGYLGLSYEVVNQLTDIRKNNRLAQHDLATKAGIAQPTLAKIESGRGNPTLFQLVRIARALDMKIKLEPHKFSPGEYVDFD